MLSNDEDEDAFAERHCAQMMIRDGVCVSSGIRILPHWATSLAVNTGHGVSADANTPVVLPFFPPGCKLAVRAPLREHLGGVSLLLSVQTWHSGFALHAAQHADAVVMG